VEVVPRAGIPDTNAFARHISNARTSPCQCRFATHLAHECVLEEMGEPESRYRASLRLLQLLPRPLQPARHSRDGSWPYESSLDKSRLDECRTARRGVKWSRLRCASHAKENLYDTRSQALPKCSTQMGVVQNVLIIPAASNPSQHHDLVSTTVGLTAAAFCCPDCRFVELYRQQMEK
jgi:hypothetical protein